MVGREAPGGDELNTYYVFEALCQAHATLLSFNSLNSPVWKSLVSKVAMALPAHREGQDSSAWWRKKSYMVTVHNMNGRHFEFCRTLWF